jgi:glycerate dehydrogenase
MKTVIVDAFTSNPGDLSWDSIEQLTSLTIYPRTSPDQLLKRVQNAEAVLTNKVCFDRQLLEQLPKLKYIGVLATGTNVIDLQAASDLGICVTNIPAYSTPFVAQHTFALILEIMNKVQLHSETARAGRWDQCIDFSYTLSPLHELKDKTLGIIGLGSIGQSVAKIAQAFDMKIVALESFRSDSSDSIFQRLNREDFFRQSDIISLHCPLTPDTQEIINADNLALMKSSGVIINTGRGPLINEVDLANALNTNQIAAAGLDVLSTEPPAPNNPLLTAANCLITPHIAWASVEARTRLIAIASENIAAFQVSKPMNQVN